jgi:hypothetical protein
MLSIYSPHCTYSLKFHCNLCVTFQHVWILRNDPRWVRIPKSFTTPSLGGYREVASFGLACPPSHGGAVVELWPNDQEIVSLSLAHPPSHGGAVVELWPNDQEIVSLSLAWTMALSNLRRSNRYWWLLLCQLRACHVKNENRKSFGYDPKNGSCIIEGVGMHAEASLLNVIKCYEKVFAALHWQW